MIRNLFKLTTRKTRGESGQALLLVMLFLLIGSLTLVPVLAHMNTALKTNASYEKKSSEFFTADSGIEEGMWRVKYDAMDTSYSPYDYSSNWSYQTNTVNSNTANYSVQNVWLPSNVGPPSASNAKVIIESEKLRVVGTGSVPGTPYTVTIDFTPDAGDNLTVKSLGVWLPQGFTYNYGDPCDLELLDEGDPCHPDNFEDTMVPGGRTLIWSYDSDYPHFIDFPGVDPDATPMTLIYHFKYYPPADYPDATPLAVAWITTEMTDSNGFPVADPDSPENVPVSWDVDTCYFYITSESGNTMIQAYSNKSSMRQMGDAMSGDYVAIGDSMLSNDDGGWGDYYRETWHTPSSYTLNTISDDADVVAAYLYWSGWRMEEAKVNALDDSCSDFTNWSRYYDTLNNKIIPISDNDSSGTWTPTPTSPTTLWDKVDETIVDNDDYITSPSASSGYMFFGFDPLSIPGGTTIHDLTVYVTARDASSGTNDIRPAIKIKGDSSTYRYGTGNNPGYSWPTTPYSYTWTTNPKTGAAWQAEDFNGSSADALQLLGVYSTDLNPAVRVSMVYAEIHLDCWTISSGKFQGRGSAIATTDERTLTLKNSLDLSSYAPRTVYVTWKHTESGYLEESDALYFSFYNGSSWSPNIEAFHGDSPSSFFWYEIPEDYLTSNFKIRFYYNFDSADEYVYLDEIKVSYLEPDTEITFKIDGTQVFFDGSAAACEPPANSLTAGRYYTMPNNLQNEYYGYSYACVRDVTLLVKTFAEESASGTTPGNATYTVDEVMANNGKTSTTTDDSHFSYAGWSLIVVYASPATAGHYIYIRDDNFAFHEGFEESGSLDFDADGEEGGTITDFIIPEPIKDKNGQITETVAARLTCFVIEADSFSWPMTDTSSLIITGKTSGKSMSLGNDSDCFDSQSYPVPLTEGVDIDTYEINWDDTVDGVPVLTPKDDSLDVDMYSDGDAWNLVYFIISIRSETKTSGTEHYVIYNN